jgi:hypothetical protein
MEILAYGKRPNNNLWKLATWQCLFCSVQLIVETRLVTAGYFNRWFQKGHGGPGFGPDHRALLAKLAKLGYWVIVENFNNLTIFMAKFRKTFLGDFWVAFFFKNCKILGKSCTGFFYFLKIIWPSGENLPQKEC